jgi:hypothetical protein
MSVSQELYPNSVLASFKAMFLVKHKTAVLLMYAEGIRGCFCLQGIKAAIRSKLLVKSMGNRPA